MTSDVTKVCYYNSILDTIGRTPHVRLNRVTRGARGLILAKVESFNPGRLHVEVHRANAAFFLWATLGIVALGIGSMADAWLSRAY